jgi:hypothetical protein
MPSYHLDTCYLFSLLLKEKDRERIARDSLRKLKERGYAIRVSAVAMRAVKEAIDKRITFSSDLLSSLGVEIYSLGREEMKRFVDLLNRLRSRREPGHALEPTDCMIVAYSMADKESRGLLTFDGKLTQSRRIKDVVERHLKDRKRFEVTDHIR